MAHDERLAGQRIRRERREEEPRGSDLLESGRFRGVWKLRLMRAVTGKAAWFVIYTHYTGASFMSADPRESPALHGLGEMQPAGDVAQKERWQMWCPTRSVNGGHRSDLNAQ